MGETKVIQALTKVTITSSPEKTFPRESVCGTADGLEVASGRVHEWGASLTDYGDAHRSTWCKSGVLAAPQMLDPAELRGTYGTDQPDGCQRAATGRV